MAIRAGINVSPAAWKEPSGISSYVLNLVKAMTAIDDPRFDLAFFAVSRTRPKPEAASVFGDRLSHLKFSERAASRVFLLAPLSKLFFGSLDAYLETSLFLPRLGRATHSVFVVHDLIPFVEPRFYPPGFRRGYGAAVRRSLQLAHAVVVPSKATRNDLARLFPAAAGKIAVIPDGVDMSRFRPDIEPETVREVLARHGLPKPYILFTGAVQPRKNLETLARAFAAVSPRVPHHLVIAGPLGWRGHEILEHIRTSPAGRKIRWAGYLPSEDLPAIYRGADLYAFPSLREGFGLTVLEAFACGVPVVTSNTSSPAEVGEAAAALVDPTDAGALANVVLGILEDEDVRRRMVARGLETAAVFSWTQTARLTLDVLDPRKAPEPK